MGQSVKGLIVGSVGRVRDRRFGKSRFMCRLFGMLSVEATDAMKYLLQDPCSLYAQSSANRRRLQGDGWGIGFYVDGALNLIKSGGPVYEEREKFTSAVREAESELILAHIRRASNPRRLQRQKIISIENSQPFKYQDYLFAHNGTITIPDEIAESLGEWKQEIKSLNDSEVYFWYMMKAMVDGSRFPEALRKFEKDLQELWRRNRERYPSADRPYIGLNAVLSDGEKLYAYCKYHERDESRRSLCLADQPVFQMSYLISPTRLVVASEKTNRKDNWKSLKSGQFLTGRIMNREVSIDIAEIE